MANRWLLLTILLACLPLGADALTDLRASLARFQGAEPVKATVDFQFWRQTSEEGGPVILQGAVATRVEDGPQGLRITWDHGTLQTADREQRAAALSPAAQAPTTQMMKSLTALDVAERLNEGETLERLLAQSTLQETKPEAWQGKPAQLLVLSLAPLLYPPSLRNAVKEVKAQARVWVDPEGVPLAYRSEVTYKGSRYLIRFQGVQKEEIHFVRVGNRLVGAWTQNEERQNGLGQSLANRRTYRIVLN
jgi:hypothetical protein